MKTAPNLLARDFRANQSNQVWVADITYIPTDEGWLYLSVVLDVFSRTVVGRSMADHLRATLVEDALTRAPARRQPLPGELIHHSDLGVQYTSGDFQTLLGRHQITCSMSRRGDCCDNAMMESFFGTLKTELVDHESYATHEAAKRPIFEYIECWYNRKRLHSSLGYLSPAAFEKKPHNPIPTVHFFGGGPAMPLCFQATCRNCKAKYLEVCYYLSLRNAGVDVPLPHPCESDEVEKFGLTLESAAMAGRIRMNTGFVCRQCGAVFYSPSLKLPEYFKPRKASMIVAAIVVLTLLVCFELAGFHRWWALLAVVLVAIVTMLINRRLVRMKVLKEHGFPVNTRCQSCDSSNTVEIGDFILNEKGVMLCDKCGARDKICAENGISIS